MPTLTWRALSYEKFVPAQPMSRASDTAAIESFILISISISYLQATSAGMNNLLPHDLAVSALVLLVGQSGLALELLELLLLPLIF